MAKTNHITNPGGLSKSELRAWAAAADRSEAKHHVCFRGRFGSLAGNPSAEFLVAMRSELYDWIDSINAELAKLALAAEAEAEARRIMGNPMPAGVCPRCGEDDIDQLLWDDDGESIDCQRCGTRFQIMQIR